MLHVTVKSVAYNEDGTETVVLSCDSTDVLAEGIAWFDVDNDNDVLLAVFEEWHAMALEGEEGFSIV